MSIGCTVTVEITQNTGLFQNTSFKEGSNIVVGQAMRVTINFYQKGVFQSPNKIKSINRSKLYQ